MNLTKVSKLCLCYPLGVTDLSWYNLIKIQILNSHIIVMMTEQCFHLRKLWAYEYNFTAIVALKYNFIVNVA